LQFGKERLRRIPFSYRLLRVHFSGEKGIDSGAIAEEFYTKLLPNVS
jgi:hypothetical protein